MGPEATALLMTRIISLTPARDDSDHIPLYIDNNTQVPSRIKALIEQTGEDPGPVLLQMAVQLERLGARALAMPCNTAHYYAEQIQQATSIPLINMVEQTVYRVANQDADINTVGILGSPAIKILKLFDTAFARHGIAMRYPEDQPKMLKAIRAIKSGRGIDEAKKILIQASQELSHSGAQTLLVACSEFSIISDTIPETLDVIDTINVLAQSVVDFACTDSCRTSHDTE